SQHRLENSNQRSSKACRRQVRPSGKSRSVPPVRIERTAGVEDERDSSTGRARGTHPQPWPRDLAANSGRKRENIHRVRNETVGAVYDRAFFPESTNYARS